MTHALTLKIVHGLDPMIVSSPKKRARGLTLYLVLNMVSICASGDTIPAYNSIVWCWGWDGAGDLDGPDVDPIWERMPNKSAHPGAVVVQHDRSMSL